MWSVLRSCGEDIFRRINLWCSFPEARTGSVLTNCAGWLKERPEIREHLFEYVQALTFQCVQTGLCGVRHDREQRLASWLCLASDAADVRALPVTQDYLSSVLGLRRAGVTQTLSRFEERGLIRKMRGVLQIDEPKCLEKRACCCYELISGAYASSQSAIPTKELIG